MSIFVLSIVSHGFRVFEVYLPVFSVTSPSSLRRKGITGATSPYVTPSVRQAVHIVNKTKALELLKVENRVVTVILTAFLCGCERSELYGRSQDSSYGDLRFCQNT
jgi:hypothetical protein